MPETVKTNCLPLEAPDEVIAGLLGVYAAWRLELTAGSLFSLPEYSDCWRLAAVEDGTVCAAAEVGSFVLTSKQAAALPGSGAASLMPREDCTVVLMVIGGTVPDRILRETASWGGLFFPKGGEAVCQAFQELVRRQENGRSVSAAVSSSEAYQMLLRLYRAGTSQAQLQTDIPEVVADAIALMQREFAFLGGVADLADRLGYSQEYLTRMFRKHTGDTPGKYLTRLRVEHAKLLLRGQGHSVAFVSDACGFSSGNYFARIFRQFTGMSPVEYARSVDEPPLTDDVLNTFYVL